MPDRILISELYGPVLQGEGALVGKVSHFLRTSGCAYRCTWCDSMHAVDPLEISEKSRSLTRDEIVKEVMALPKVPWVTITGGDPVAWDLTEIVFALNKGRMGFGLYKVAVETQGALWHDWLNLCDLVTVSPKPPSSGMADRLQIAMLQKYVVRLGKRMIFKIVAFDNEDLDFVERIHSIFPDIDLYITSGTPEKGYDVKSGVLLGYKVITEEVLKRPSLFNATVNCQQHVLLYGRELGR